MGHLFIVCLLLLCKTCFTQNYVPLLSNSNEWYVHYVLFGSDVDVHFFSRDTLINNQTYYKTFKEEPIYGIDFIGYMAEDTLAKKVYAYDKEQNGDGIVLNSQKLLYDFDINIGDTIDIYTGEGNFSLHPSKLVLHKIQYNVLSEPCFMTPTVMPVTKVFVFTISGFGQDTINWIEGTGSLAGVLMPGNRGGFCSFTRLNCHYKDGINIFKTGYPQYQDTCSLGGVAIENALSNHLNLYPNPTNDIIKVELRKGEYIEKNVEILDVTGNVLITHNIDKPLLSVSIPLKTLSSGVYLCRISTKESSYTNIFIKH